MDVETRKQLLLKVNISGLTNKATQFVSLRMCRIWVSSWMIRLKMLGHSLTVDAKKTLVNAFVASCLDFCNSLYHGIGDQGSTGQIWASSDCGGQTRKLGNTTIYLWFFMFCVAYSNGAIGPCPFRPKKSVFDKRKKKKIGKKWLALFVYLFKQFFQAFKC